MARGIYYVDEAWRKRGELMGDRTSIMQMVGFHRYLDKAHDELVASIPLYARPVDSYRYLVRVDKGRDGDEARELLDQALRLDPRALDVRLEYLDAITPRWGGSKEEMASFLSESNRSQMTDLNKKRLEGRYYYALAQQARLEKDYRAGSGYFYKCYLTNHEPNVLLWSAEIAIDADDKNLALQRLDELVKSHPKYGLGYEYRAQVYEYKFNDAGHAIPDYLAAADLGAAWSQNHMGWFYMKGIAVPVDYGKARHYLELAAQQGNQTARENLELLKDLERGK